MSRKRSTKKYGASSIGILLLGTTMTGVVWWAFLCIRSVTPPSNRGNIKLDHVALLSYTTSLEEYRSAIPGLLYTPQIVSGVKEPHFFKLEELFQVWPPDSTALDAWPKSLAHPDRGNGVARFDYRVQSEREKAQEYRDTELPFILTGVPEVESAAEAFSVSQLLDTFKTPVEVEKSSSNHFMYYKVLRDVGKTGSKFRDWVPPQQDVRISFEEYLRLSEEAESYGPAAGGRPLHYLTLSSQEGFSIDWIRAALPFFKREQSFFVVQPRKFSGINCRFGMRGVIAEAHYDGGRNFVAMVRGRKRYVLLPPRACAKLYLLPNGHPSARHASFDWSNPQQMKAHPNILDAEATEVVLSRGEVLYIPNYWFHYIVSQDASIQCNARSGLSEAGLDEIERCEKFNLTTP